MIVRNTMAIALICFASATFAKGPPHMPTRSAPLLPANRGHLPMPRDKAKAEAMTMITTMTVVIRPSVTRARTVTGATLSEAIRSTGTLTGPEIARQEPTGGVLTGSETVREEPIG